MYISLKRGFRVANERVIECLVTKILNDGDATDPTINRFWSLQLEKFRGVSLGGRLPRSNASGAWIQ
jgi:hypothetical protein